MLTLPVAGTAAEIGAQHGETLRDRITECVELYRGVFGLDDDELDRRSAHFEGVTRAWSPALADEIDAIADASGQRRSDIWAINARSEIMAFTGTTESECTSVLAPKLGIMAQNWDWISKLEPLTVVLDVTHTDGHRCITVTEPGMVGKVGLSSAGVAVGLNFLYSPARLDGIPVHVLLRAMLDARDGADLDALVASAGPSRSAHVFMARRDPATAATTGTSFEFTGTDTLRADSADAPLLHTNHFLLTDGIPQGAGGPNSVARHDRSCQLVAQGAANTKAGIHAFLDDQGNPDFPICRPWAPSANIAGLDVGTVCAIIVRLNDATMDVRRGPDPSGPWQHHTI